MLQRHDGARFSYVQAFCGGRRAWPGHVPQLLVPLIGRFTSHGGFRNRNRESEVVPHVVEAGTGTVMVGGRSWQVGPGDVFVLFPDTEVVYHDDPRRPWRYRWFRLAGASAPAVLALAGLTPAEPVGRGGYHEALVDLLDEGFAALAAGDLTPSFPERLAWQLVEAMQRIGARRPAPDLAQRLRRHLEANAHREISIAGLARTLGVSRSTLFRHFQAAYGQSPNAFLLAHRLRRAIDLLADRDLAIADVARRCGFASPSYFCRQFARAHGMPPRRWRTVSVL